MLTGRARLGSAREPAGRPNTEKVVERCNEMLTLIEKVIFLS